MRALPVAAAALLIASACGGHHGTAAKPAGKRKVRIVDAGQIYDALNTTDCIKWPSDEVKKKAGYLAWGHYYPGGGEVGEVIAELPHCDGKTRVVLVAIGDHVVPVTSKGVEDAPDTADTTPDDGTGGDGYGFGLIGGLGAIGGDAYGFGDGYGDLDWGDVGDVGYGGLLGTDTGYTFQIGDTVEIVDTGQLYTTINNTDCLKFPSAEMKKQAGSGAWGSYYPTAGETGTVVFIGTHCDNSATVILVLQIGNYLVPIGATGVALY